MATRFHRVLLIALFLALAPLARGQTLEVLHSFNGSDGRNPRAELLQVPRGEFYGTTASGGTNDNGTIFKVTSSGAFTSLVSFNIDNGRSPEAGLIYEPHGDGLVHLFGTTVSGGVSNYGTIFKYVGGSGGSTLTTLISFANSNGRWPKKLFQHPLGDFYGITLTGGTSNYGTIFRLAPDLAPNGLLISLVSFIGSNGSDPLGGLAQGIDGDFYGTTSAGGLANFGTVFRMTPFGTLTTLFSFTADSGRYPEAGLIRALDGNFYGTTAHGGLSDNGTVFKITPSGVLTTLVSFTPSTGTTPLAELVQGNDGHFYGTTSGGGANFQGTVFKMTADGTLSTLVSFASTNGASPVSSLVQANDGNLYGTTSGGGAFFHGTIFRIVMPVTLNSHVNGNELVLSWPTNALGFTLQSAVDLNSPTNWIDFTNAPAIVGSQFMVTNSLSSNARFYRLKKP